MPARPKTVGDLRNPEWKAGENGPIKAVGGMLTGDWEAKMESVAQVVVSFHGAPSSVSQCLIVGDEA